MTTTANNQAISKSISALYIAREALYTQASAASDESVKTAIYAAIDSITAQCEALDVARLPEPINPTVLALDVELGLA
jgi:hypothetical protein